MTGSKLEPTSSSPRTPQETAQRAIGVGDARVEVDKGDPERSLVEDLPEPLLALAEIGLCPSCVCDVTEAPHPSDDHPVHALGPRVTLEHPAVDELEAVMALGLRIGVDIGDPRLEGFRIPELTEEPTRALPPLPALARTDSGNRHISANCLLKLVILPAVSTTRIPSAVDSSVALSSERVSRTSSSAASRAVMSWPRRRSPATVGSSSRLTSESSKGTESLLAWRSRRTWTVTGLDALAPREA